MNIFKLKDDLMRDEANIRHAYQDSLGYWTIGVGHLIDRRRGGELSDAVIGMILHEDINSKIEELNEKLPWWVLLGEDCQRAIVNMAFNLGVKGLLGFPKFLAALQEGDNELAAKEMLESTWSKQVGARADRLAALVRSGT